MSGRSGRILVLSDSDKKFLASSGWGLPPSASIPSRNKTYREFHYSASETSNHIPGNCLAIPESRGAPPGVRYAARTLEPIPVTKLGYASIAPPVLDLTKRFLKDANILFSKDYFVYFNCNTGMVEAVIPVTDTEARTFYDHYYSCPDMVKGLRGDLFKVYTSSLSVLCDYGVPRVWLSGPDMIHYIQTTQSPLTGITFSRGLAIRYAGVDANSRPANMDIARVRTVVLTYGIK